MEFKDRLKHARKLRKISQGRLGEAVGLDQTSISDLEQGRTRSSGKTAEIAAFLGVSSIWLAQGVGEMIPDEGKGSANTAPAAQPIRYQRYPVVSEVQAGRFSECVVPYEPGNEDQYESTDYAAKGPAFWLEVTGDSMTAPAGARPSIPEGTMVLVDTGIEAEPGKLVVAQLDDTNEATFKKLIIDGGQKYLKALNPAYPLIAINGNCRIVGVAVEAKTKL